MTAGEFMKANLVGTVIILSLIIWIPVSCCVSYQDRKRKRQEEEENKWLSANVSENVFHIYVQVFVCKYDRLVPAGLYHKLCTTNYTVYNLLF